METSVPPSSNPRGSVVLETPGHCLPMPAVALPAAWPCLPHARGSTRHQNGLGFLSLSALLLWTAASRRDADRTVSDSVSCRGVLPGPDRNLCQGSFSLKQSSFSCGARAHRSDHHQLPTQQQQTYFCGRVWLTTSAPRTAEIVGSKDFASKVLQATGNYRFAHPAPASLAGHHLAGQMSLLQVLFPIGTAHTLLPQAEPQIQALSTLEWSDPLRHQRQVTDTRGWPPKHRFCSISFTILITFPASLL